MDKLENIYDKKDFYDDYIKMRETKINANELIEIPIMKQLLPDLSGKTVLDLGCGYGEMSKYFVEKGASRVVAIDLSKNMIDMAKAVNDDIKIKYQVMAMEDIENIKMQFDVVFSSLAFHYVEDFGKLIGDISNLVKPNGILLFSQEHPIGSAPILNQQKSYLTIDDKRYYLVSDYNYNGKRPITWSEFGGTKYHRNFKTIINTIVESNFSIICIDESTASEEAIKIVPKYIYQNDRPYFLFVKAKRN